MLFQYRPYVFYILACMTTGVSTLHATTRRLQVGEAMPPFSITDDQGKVAAYAQGRQRAVMIAFLSSQQSRSAQAIGDLTKILTGLGVAAAQLDVFMIVDDPNRFATLCQDLAGFRGHLHVATDPGRHLWGQFGVIAVPTVIIAGSVDKVLAVAAGYGYDFASVVHKGLSQALGIEMGVSPEPNQPVETLMNNTVDARVQRLVRTAKVLREKGHLDSALTELRKAQELAPESKPVILELAELLCLTGQGPRALELLEKVAAGSRDEQAQVQLMRGWAYRQMQRLDEAETTLKTALEGNPKAARIYFELGRVYEAQGKAEQALAAYRQALILQFGER